MDEERFTMLSKERIGRLLTRNVSSEFILSVLAFFALAYAVLAYVDYRENNKPIDTSLPRLEHFSGLRFAPGTKIKSVEVDRNYDDPFITWVVETKSVPSGKTLGVFTPKDSQEFSYRASIAAEALGLPVSRASVVIDDYFTRFDGLRCTVQGMKARGPYILRIQIFGVP